MMKVNIIIDYEIFPSNISRNIITKFYVEYQGKCFPDEQWTDFAEPVLSMWTHVLLENRYSDRNNFKLSFMDGPFWLKLYKDRNMQLTIDCMNARTEKEVCEYTIICSYCDLLESLYHALKKFNYILYSSNMYLGTFDPIYKQTIISMKEIKRALKEKTS